MQLSSWEATSKELLKLPIARSGKGWGKHRSINSLLLTCHLKQWSVLKTRCQPGWTSLCDTRWLRSPLVTSAYELPDNKPFLLIDEGLLLGFYFFDLGCNCNILVQMYLVGVVQLVVWKRGTGFFVIIVLSQLWLSTSLASFLERGENLG